VMSGATAGTQVELLVPGHVAFQNHSKPSWFRQRFLPTVNNRKGDR
jgi:hypothetical protein